MRAILLGCPGAGKGTQAQHLADHFNFPLISTGNMLRTAVETESELGLQVKKIMERGDLVPDAIMINLVKERICKDDCKNGYLLDGFPRTISQAKALSDAGIDFDYVIEIFVPDEEIVERMSGRRVHVASGRVYHLKHKPPRNHNIDDITGEQLIQRDDDKESTIRERLRIYHERTEPLVKYYQDLAAKNAAKALHCIHINGVGTIAQVQQRIFSNMMNFVL